MVRPAQCTIQQLKEVIKNLNDDDILQVNPVGNLSILRPTEGGEYFAEWIGVIELGNADLDTLMAVLDIFEKAEQE